MLWKLGHLVTLSTEGDLSVHYGFVLPADDSGEGEQGFHAQN